MQNKRIKLTSYEQQIIRDTDFLLSKRIITSKTEEIWLLLKAEIQPVWNDFLLNNETPGGFEAYKISKGENYKGLPYIALDYPRCYTKEDIFGYRSMFWWGHYYIFTLLLHGKFLDTFRQKIGANYSLLKNRGVFFENGNSPWEYDLAQGTYSVFNTDETEVLKIISEKPFLKLGRTISLGAPAEEVIEFGKETFALFIELLR